MTGIMSEGKNRSWNPLKCGGTSLPENLLLVAKLLVIYLLLAGGPGFGRSGVFLPFILVFDQISSPLLFLRTLEILFLIFSISLIFNNHVRLSCLALGLVLLISIFASRLLFSNTRFFYASFLILIGLHDKGWRQPFFLRWQVAIVYFGAGLNKLLNMDWRSGQYFEFWTQQLLHLEWYKQLADFFPEMALSQFMCWLTIIIELALAVGFLVHRLHSLAIGLGIFFHAGMLIFSGGFTIPWIFLYAMCSSYLVFIDWPTQLIEITCSYKLNKNVVNIFKLLDFENKINWKLTNQKEKDLSQISKSNIQLTFRGNLYTSWRAYLILIRYNPMLYFFLAAVLIFFQTPIFSWLM